MRLAGKQDFAGVFERGRRSADRCFTMLGCANGLEIGRLGLAISRKAARRATSRNRLKRLAREAFRHHQHTLAGLDVIVMARPEQRAQQSAIRDDQAFEECSHRPGID